MIKRKGKFLTFCFSMIPGAGHMYLGFMKMGISLITMLCGTLFFAAILRMEPILFLLPILWFYSFFDTINKNSMKNEDFYQIEDHYLFNINFSELTLLLQGKFRKVIAITFILIGASLLFSNFTEILRTIIGWDAYYQISSYFDAIPQLILAFFIIYAGIRLIQGKKFELYNHETTLETNTITKENKDQTFSEDITISSEEIIVEDTKEETE